MNTAGDQDRQHAGGLQPSYPDDIPTNEHASKPELPSPPFLSIFVHVGTATMLSVLFAAAATVMFLLPAWAIGILFATTAQSPAPGGNNSYSNATNNKSANATSETATHQRTGQGNMRQWLIWGGCYAVLIISFVAAALSYGRQLGLWIILKAQGIKLLAYIVALAFGIVIVEVTTSSFPGNVLGPIIGVALVCGYISEISYFCFMNGGQISGKTFLASLSVFAYAGVLGIIVGYVMAVKRLSAQEVGVHDGDADTIGRTAALFCVTGVVYPALVLALQGLFFGVLNKIWSSSEGLSADSEGTLERQMRGKKWLAFTLTVRNLAASVKLPNIVLIFLTTASLTDGQFMLNAALSGLSEIVGNWASSLRFTSSGMAVTRKLQDSFVRRTNSGNRKVGAAVHTQGELKPARTTSRLRRGSTTASNISERLSNLEGIAHKQANEELGELTAIVFGGALSIMLANKFLILPIDGVERMLAIRAIWMMALELAVDFLKHLIWRRREVHMCLFSFWAEDLVGVTNSGFTLLATALIICGAVLE